MINYKKSLLSVAAAVAISSSVVTAGYIPLNSAAKDNQWVLFGVSGFITTGVVSSTPKEFSIADSTANAITDTTADDAAVSGLTTTLGDTGGGDLGKLKAKSTVPVEIRVDTTTDSIEYYQAEAVRTIYVSATAGDTPSFAFEYKASLEGKKLEYKINNGTAYEILIDDVYTYDNPGTGTVVTGVSVGTSVEMDDMTGDESAIDYDFSDNPIEVSQYVNSAHQTAIGDADLRMYSYDAISKTWGAYDTRNTVGTNNFNTLVKSKGYWAKLDANGDGTTAPDEEGGVVLDSTSLSAADYTTAGLADGWNLIAFDDSNTKIKYASTGMILDINVTATTDTMIVIDSSGNHELTVTFNAVDINNTATVSKKINIALDTAKIEGTIPHTFDLKAFPASASAATAEGKIVMISNKRFSLKNGLGSPILSGTTLNAASLWDESTQADMNYAATAFPTASAVRSKYGEYAVVIEPLTGTGTASTLTNNSILNINYFDSANSNAYETTDTRITVNGSNNALKIALDTEGTEITATELNLDLNGTLEHILIASDKQFFLRDNTFSRVFTYTDSAVDGIIKITSAGSISIDDQTITANANTAATDVASDINLAGGSTLGAGAPTETGETSKIVFVANQALSSEFYIAETTGDHLSATTTSSDLAKGSVKGVYSLGSLAKKAIKNVVDVNISGISDSSDDNITFTYFTTLGSYTGTSFAPNPAASAYDSTGGTTLHNIAALDNYVTQINSDLSDANITATASHNYDSSVNDAGAIVELASSVITISGSEVIDITASFDNEATTATEQFIVDFVPGLSLDDNNTFTFNGNTVDLNETVAGEMDTTAKVIIKLVAVLTDLAIAPWKITSSNATSIVFDYNDTADATNIVVGNFSYDDGDNNDTSRFPAADTIGFTTADINITLVTEGKAASAIESMTATADLGYLENTTPDLTDDLKYNTIYSPNYVMDGPLFVLKEAGYRVKGLVTGTRDLVYGDVDWDSIDLTRPPSEWLSSQDYNLFDTDDRSGYWANLENVGVTNPIIIGTATITKNYTHHFDTTATSTSTPAADATYNFYSGNISIPITGIDYDTDDAASARVTASINGKKVELTRDGSTDNYTGKISFYETGGMTMNSAHEITIDVSDGLGNKLSETLPVTTFDNVKPDAPVVAINGVGLDITIDAAVAGYYVFDNAIPESGTIAAAKVASATPAITNICKDLAAVDFTSEIGSIKVIAVDGNGILNQGNASDATSVAYMPILKGRNYISDSHSSGLPVVTAEGNVYNSDCEVASLISAAATTGVTISTITEGKVTKLAYTTLGEDATQIPPITFYVSDGEATPTITAITYPDDYVGEDVFIDIDGQAFRYQLPTRAIAEATSTASPTSLNVAANILTGISF